MKTIYKYIGIVTALLAIAPAASAQSKFLRGAGNQVEGLELNKTVDQTPDENGVRWIELESYVTGAVTVKKVAKPADIVLVLDVSGSMDEPMYDYTFNARSSRAYSYDTLNSYGHYETINNRLVWVQDYYFYKHTDGNYYPVINKYYETTSGWGWNQETIRHYYLTFSVDGIDHYLSGNSVTTTRPSTPSGTQGWGGWSGTDDTIWTGVLYTRSQTPTGEKKIDALINSVNLFVDVIHENDIYETDEDGKIVLDDQGHKVTRKDEEGHDTTLGNRISIVKFAGDALNNTSVPTDGTSTYEYDIQEGQTHYEGTSQYTEVLARFLPATDEEDITKTNEDLTSIADHLYALGGTSADYGTEKAILLFSWLEEQEQDRESNRTVIFFTDGMPTHTSGFNNAVANAAISNANTLKTTYGAKVFSIGVFADLGGYASDVDKYMNYISSNYTGKQSMTSEGTKTASGFYRDASGNDLSEIFKAVATESGGDGSGLDEESVVEIDVVSSSFTVPVYNYAGGDYAIQFWTAKCTGYDNDGKGNSFATPVQLEDEANNMTNVDGSKSTVGFDEDELDNNVVSVDGFDFAKNFCGRRTDEDLISPENPEGYYADGYKLIVRIPIIVNDDAVGGAATKTNDPASGIYVDGILQKSFPEPDIDIPVNLWIHKYGLEKGESSKFTIERKSIDGGDWQYYATVIITGTGEIVEDSEDNYNGFLTSPTYKLDGLNNKYYYRVIEEGWSWSYDNHADTAVSTETLTKNPVIFVNSKEKTSPKHAESKAINQFGEGYNAKMVDSRGYLK